MKILTIVGARPQFIKAAAVSRAMGQNDISEVMVHTGQHHDPELSDIFFSELSIPRPIHQLGVHGGNHGSMTGRMLIDLEPVMLQENPDLVLVYGDTNSTLAGALVAAKAHVPVAHVEAGLRSFNREMPEEINRIVADHLSDVLFCPTSRSVENLEREGLHDRVHLVGDVMYDISQLVGELAAKSSILDELSLQENSYSVATIHRAENTDNEERLSQLLDYLKDQASDHVVVFPVHPRTEEAFKRFGLDTKGLKVIPPLGYMDMTRLVQGATCIYTDSGGLQKEAYFHRIPCVTLRSETEWVETIDSGWNRLWTEESYRPRREITEYGNGRTAEKIVEVLHGFLKL